MDNTIEEFAKVFTFNGKVGVEAFEKKLMRFAEINGLPKIDTTMGKRQRGERYALILGIKHIPNSCGVCFGVLDFG